MTFESALTKQDLEVPVAVSQDEKELLLMKTLGNPHIREEEAAGMTKEMKSMRTLMSLMKLTLTRSRLKLWRRRG